MLIIQLATHQLELLERRVDQIQLVDVVQEEGQVVVRQIERLEVEYALAVSQVVI